METLLQRPLEEVVGALHAGRVSPVELMEAVLRRIEETRDALNAVIAVRKGEVLLTEAREAESRIARGEARPLEGVPFGVKDLEDVAGMVTSFGSVPYRDNVATADSVQVARLRAAGAIAVGKTNTPEFGHTGVTKNFLFGATRSPWSPDRTPGGSSGGSAAALVGGVLPLVTASDGGGSIRIPASFCGAFGMKPSFGRIPRGPEPLWEHGATTVLGPLTRTVRDAALVLDQVVGPDPVDPRSLPHPGRSYREVVEEPLPAPLRIGFSPDLGYAVVQSDVAAVVEEAVSAFSEMGHRVAWIRGGPPEMVTFWGLLLAFELGGSLSGVLETRKQDLTRSLVTTIEEARRTAGTWWGEMARRRNALARWCAEVFSRYDLLLTPTVPYDPPPPKGPLPTETEGRPQPVGSVASFTAPFNLSWNPAATVRAGLSAAGLPVGLQIVAPQHRDDLVLRAARAYERLRPWDRDWPRGAATHPT